MTHRLLCRSVVGATSGLWGLTLVPLLALAPLPNLAADVRAGLAFELAAQRGTPAELAGIATTNGRVVIAVALAGWAARRIVPLRPGLDAVVVLTAALNATLVGVALGAYGSAAVPWLVHLPIEWAALGVMLGLYRTQRGHRVPSSLAIAVTGAALVLVVLGAAAETFLTPQH